MATFTDDFNRTDGSSVGSDWNVLSGYSFNIVSNQVGYTSGSTALSLNAPSSLSFDADQSAEADFIFTSSDNDIGLAVRAIDGNNYYRAFYNPAGDDFFVRKVVSGTNSNLFGVSNVGLTSGDTIKFEVIGSTITLYMNGSSIGTIEDTDLTTGYPAILYQAKGASRHDNFVASGLVVAPTASIVNVDTDNTITDGQQDVPITVSGFSGDLTTVSLKVGNDTIPLTNLVKTS